MRTVKILLKFISIKTNHHSEGRTVLLKGSEIVVHINY